MSEKFNFSSNRDTTAGIFFIKAIVASGKLNEIMDKHPRDGSDDEVQLLINGVEVPFVSVVDDIWKYELEHITERALEIAKKMITKAKLDDVMNALNDIEWKMEAALQKVSLTLDEK